MSERRSIKQRCKNLWASLLRICGFLAVLPYGSIYRRNTPDPIVEKGNEHSAISGLESWARLKLKEAQYVQVAVCL